jgi:hypothetical protein
MWCANEGFGALQALLADVQRQCVQQTARPPDDPLPEHRPLRPNGAAQEARE